MNVGPDELKPAAAQQALDLVEDGMLLGLGSGSTAELFVGLLGERVAAGLSVTGVATQLQKEGLISYRRGKIQILSMDLVERRACECHSAVREQFVELFGHTDKTPKPSGAGQIRPE